MHQRETRNTGLLDDAIRASNALTARWAGAAEGPNFVLSGAGLWPLLALLASGAAGPARDELVEAVGLPAESAQEAAVALLECIDAGSATSAALGLWVHDRITLLDSWAKHLPDGVVGRLSGPDAQDSLDTWASERTGGVIEKFPLEIEEDDDLVLATALAARTQWQVPFDESVSSPRSGAWANLQVPALRRYGPLADTGVIEQADGVTTTRVIVTGRDDLDVHLVIGAVDAPAGSVIGAGIAALDPASTVIPVESLPIGFTGHGLTVREIMSSEPGDLLGLHVPPFTVRSSHDLCSPPTLFGLATAMAIDPYGHFPLMSEHPQFVGKGVQDVVATFSATGFEAAAVTAFGLAGGIPERTERIRFVDVTFDRPFGFIAVHRPTGLVVVAGWVGNAPEVPDSCILDVR